MNGIRILAAYIGIAWVLAGAGATWTSCASASELDAAADARIALANEETKALIDDVTKEKEEVTTKAQTKIDKADKKLAAEEAKLEKAGELQNAKAAPTKRRDAAKLAVEKLNEARDTALAELDKRIEELGTENTEAIASIKDDTQRIEGGVTWRPVLGLVIGLLLLGAGMAPGFTRKNRFDIDDV